MQKQKSPRILLFDIETTPLISYNWGIHEQNAIKVIQDWYILSFAYKWLGDKKTQVVALPDFPLYKKNNKSDLEVVKKLHALFDEADIIIAHNGDSFDVKKSNARFIFHKLSPPSPYKTIDTLKIARKHFKLTSNRLGSVGEYLGLGAKEETGGFALWESCMQGDMEAWNQMKKYNKRDVELLELVYCVLQPWVKNVRLNVFKEGTCPACMSEKVQRRGYDSSNSLWYQRYKCMACGAWFRGQSLGKVKPEF